MNLFSEISFRASLWDSLSLTFETFSFRAVFRWFFFFAIFESFFFRAVSGDSLPCHVRDTLFVPWISSHAVYRRFSLPAFWRGSSLSVSLSVSFSGDYLTVPLSIFLGGFSVRTKKCIRGFFSVHFFFRRVSFCAVFKGNIWIDSVFFPCRFKEGVSWDSHTEYTRPSILAIVHRLRKTRALLYSAQHASVQKRAHCFLSAKYTHQQIRKNRGKQPGANIHMREY